MLCGSHSLPLSFAICRMRPPESVTPGPPGPPGHLILQCPISWTLKHFHMSTLTWLLSLPAERSQPALLPGLERPPRGWEADGYSRAASPMAPTPTETQHPGWWALCKHSPPSPPWARQCLRTTWVYLGSAGCGECYHSQGTPSPILTAYSGPSPWMLQALWGKEVSLLLSNHQRLQERFQVSEKWKQCLKGQWSL